MTTTGQNRIMIYGPNSDGTYIIEFRMADGESLLEALEGSLRIFEKHRIFLLSCSVNGYAGHPAPRPAG
jgi:hypothetical protein